jgi:hypothetical protein
MTINDLLILREKIGYLKKRKKFRNFSLYKRLLTKFFKKLFKRFFLSISYTMYDKILAFNIFLLLYLCFVIIYLFKKKQIRLIIFTILYISILIQKKVCNLFIFVDRKKRKFNIYSYS